MADQGQRTEQPTDRRIEQARREGNFAVSREFVSSLQFVAFVGLVVAFSTDGLSDLRRLTRHLLNIAFEQEMSITTVSTMVQHVLVPASIPLWMGGLLLVAITVGVQLATTGMGVSLKKLQPDLNRLKPATKIKNLPRQNLQQFLQALVLLPLFLFVVYLLVRDDLGAFLQLPLLSVEAGIGRLGTAIRELLWKAAGLFVILGCVDLFRQRRRYRKDLRMTKQEIRDEVKEIEGNPHTKARIRRLQRELLRRQMMKDVSQASAVIVNPTHYAVALRYDVHSMAAPKVVAKGKNFLARRIRERAMKHEVPIVENPPLARALYSSAEVGQEIPVHLYRAVAEILAYLYRVMNTRPNGPRPQDLLKG